MNTTAIGRRAEDAAATYLARRGYTVLDRNWRTRWCEIDIVAQKDQVVYFVEVKYRRSDCWGSGLDYITPAKLRQMRFAAEFWIARYRKEVPCGLIVVEVEGVSFRLTNFLHC